jgi:hypothetical protein
MVVAENESVVLPPGLATSATTGPAGEGTTTVTNTDEDDTIESLIRRLDSDTSFEARDAGAKLIHRGPGDVVQPLVHALPSLGHYGQLFAVEVLEQLADPDAVQTLIALLTSDDSTVREWSADALARMRIHEAVPALRRAYEAGRARHDPPGGTEPVALRRALTDLGARQPVTPPLTASLRRTTSDGYQAWPSTRLADVIDDLAAHSQVTLYFQLCELGADGVLYYMASPTKIDLDFTELWPELVVDAHQRAGNDSRQAPVGEDILALLEWIGQDDL